MPHSRAEQRMHLGAGEEIAVAADGRGAATVVAVLRVVETGAHPLGKADRALAPDALGEDGGQRSVERGCGCERVESGRAGLRHATSIRTAASRERRPFGCAPRCGGVGGVSRP